MPAKKKTQANASEKDSSKATTNPDKVKAIKERTPQAQNVESEKDQQISALRLRVEYLEKNMDPKVLQNPTGTISIGEENLIGILQGALKTAEEELIKLRHGEMSSGDGDVPSNTVKLIGLNEKIAKLQKEIINKDTEIATIKTELNKANSSLDEMTKQLSDNRHSQKQSPRNPSPKSDAKSYAQLQEAIQKKDEIIEQLTEKLQSIRKFEGAEITSVNVKANFTIETTLKSQPTDDNTSAKLAALEASMQSKESEIKVMEDKIAQLESEAMSDKQSNAKLREDMRKKDQASIEQLNKELQSVRKELEEKGSEIQRVKEDNKSQLQRMRDENDAELQRMKEQKDNEERSKQKWMDKVKELETNTERSKSAKARSEPLQTLLEEKEAEIQTKTGEIESLKREMDGLKNKVSIDTKKLQEQLEQNKREIHRLASELGVAKKDLEIKNGELLSLQDKKKTIESELSELKTKRESQNKEIDALKKDIEDLKKTNSLRREKTMDKTASPGRDDVGVLKQQLSKANQEIDELKSRLSKMVGENLTNNNPNITDLSDENRPTKLAEMYSEIYDNEWTDAFEELAKHEKNETNVIAELLRILQNTAKFCGNVADRYIESLQKSASRLQDKSSTKNQFKKLHLLKELRKSYAPSLTEEVYSLYVEENGKPQKVEAYTKSCIRLCWLMSVQDPRVVLDEVKTPTPFDVDRYKTYTKSGKQMAYVVWPTMLLNEGGPILMKGVAQGK